MSFKIKLTQEEAELKVQQRCTYMGYEYLTFTYTGVKSTRLIISCNIHGEWNCGYSKFIHDKSGCPKCAREYTKKIRTNSYDKVLSKVKQRCKELNYTYYDFEYVDRNTKLLLKCNNPEHDSWYCSYNNFINVKTQCPECSNVGFNSNKPAYLYVNKIFYKDSIYYKIGITNNYKTRLHRLNENKNSTTECLSLFYSNDGKVVKDIEHFIKYKTNIPFGILSKDDYFDGHTETFSSEYLNDIISLCIEFENKQQIFHLKP